MYLYIHFEIWTDHWHCVSIQLNFYYYFFYIFIWHFYFDVHFIDCDYMILWYISIVEHKIILQICINGQFFVVFRLNTFGQVEEFVTSRDVIVQIYNQPTLTDGSGQPNFKNLHLPQTESKMIGQPMVALENHNQTTVNCNKVEQTKIVWQY